MNKRADCLSEILEQLATGDWTSAPSICQLFQADLAHAARTLASTDPESVESELCVCLLEVVHTLLQEGSENLWLKFDSRNALNK